MKKKIFTLCLSIFLLTNILSIEILALNPSPSFVSVTKEFKPSRKRRGAVGIYGRGYIIHRNSGTVRRAICRDGMISLSKHNRGTCSHHGGVRSWAN